jgi:hypothetical protein
MINEGRKENIFNKYQKFIEAERKLVSEYLPDGLSSAYDYLITDPFIEKTNFKYLDSLLDVHYSGWKNNPNIIDNVTPFEPNLAKNYIFMARDKNDRVVEALKFFDLNNNKYQYSDFSKYAKKDFFDFLLETDKLKQEVEEWKAKTEVDRVYEDDRLLVVSPKSYEGSCLYGAGTRWCTASKKTREHWENYSDVGVLYYLITKGVPSSNKYYKVALFANDEGEEEWWDAADNKLDSDNVELLTSAYGPGINRIREHLQTGGKTTSSIIECAFNSERKTSRTVEIVDGSLSYTFSFRDLKPGEVLFDLEVFVSRGNKTLSLGLYVLHIDGNCGVMSCDFPTLIMVVEKYGNRDLLGWNELLLEHIIVKTKDVSCELIFENYFKQMTNLLTQKILKSPIALNILTDKNTILATGYSGNYKFANRNQGLIKKLKDWLQSGKKGTRMDFLVDAGYVKKRGNVYYSTSTNSPIEARGFYSTFFASAANAGIIKGDRQGNRLIMRKGPNFKKFVDGAKIVYV